MNNEQWDCIVNFLIKRKEKQLPKTWEEFCENNPIKYGECAIGLQSNIIDESGEFSRAIDTDRNYLPNYSTAEAVLALCQLIQLRNCYNGDWLPNWTNSKTKYVIEFNHNTPQINDWRVISVSPLYFKSKQLAEKFLQNFRQLIEKLKPLYGIKEGGEK